MTERQQNERWWRFYRNRAGDSVARDELRELPEAAQTAMADLMRRIKSNAGEVLPRENVSVPGVSGLMVMKVSLAHNEYRGFYFHDGKRGQVLVAVRFYAKKTEAIPKSELTVAKQRMRDHRSAAS